MTAIQPQPGILGIDPYVGGASKAPGADRVIKLSSNENPWGASPAAVEAVRAAAADLHAYPDPSCAELRAAIGEVHGLPADRILCGNGSDELLQLLCMAYAGVGDEVVHSDHSFLLYGIFAKANGSAPVVAPDRDLTTDVDAMLEACTERTKLVFLTNPNNPTGTRLNAQEVERLAAGVPEQALLVIDAAYAEYVTGEDYDSGAALVARRDNVVMTRTFSKVYGLAALRCGWLFGPEHVIDVLHRIRGPFNVSATAQAGAAAAVRDLAFTADCVARSARLRAEMEASLRGLGVRTTDSSANFVLAEFGTGDRGAAALDAHLKAEGIIVRRMDSYGLPGWLRISIGDEEGCAACLASIRAFLA